MSQPELSLDRRIREEAVALGFDVVAVARADEPLGIEHERYEAFVAEGRHGAMRHLATDGDVRRTLDCDGILPGAKSVICVGKRYARAGDEADPELARTVARYARGRDYHRFLKKRLRRLARFVSSLAPGARARALCDIEPVLERAWAARAGLGFVGKHGLVITPGQGSYQILGEVVTTLELVADTPIAERCGSCTRCLDACPTSAFVAPFVLDPRRCIAYFTIEAPEAPPDELRDASAEHLFGCDICQEVCPFNRAAPADAASTDPFRPLPMWSDLTLEKLVRFGPEAWDAATVGSPIRRRGHEGMARNAVAQAAFRLGSHDDTAARAAIEAARAHDSSAVRALAHEVCAASTAGDNPRPVS